jgi:hypothetical protein
MPPGPQSCLDRHAFTTLLQAALSFNQCKPKTLATDRPPPIRCWRRECLSELALGSPPPRAPYPSIGRVGPFIWQPYLSGRKAHPPAKPNSATTSQPGTITTAAADLPLMHPNSGPEAPAGPIQMALMAPRVCALQQYCLSFITAHRQQFQPSPFGGCRHIQPPPRVPLHCTPEKTHPHPPYGDVARWRCGKILTSGFAPLSHT